MKVGKSVWYANRINDFNAEIERFAEPIEVKTAWNYFTVMPAVSRGYMETMKYGERLLDTWTVIANAKEFGGKIKAGDVMWVDDESPYTEENVKLTEEYENYGCTANAVVKSAVEVNYTLNITLERNQKQVKR